MFDTLSRPHGVHCIFVVLVPCNCCLLQPSEYPYYILQINKILIPIFFTFFAHQSVYPPSPFFCTHCIILRQVFQVVQSSSSAQFLKWFWFTAHVHSEEQISPPLPHLDDGSGFIFLLFFSPPFCLSHSCGQCLAMSVVPFVALRKCHPNAIAINSRDIDISFYPFLLALDVSTSFMVTMKKITIV